VTQHERDAYVLPEGFASWKTPYWADQTPHPLCHVTRDQYPDPRTCAFVHSDPFDDGYVGPCHLGHPANCRAFVNTQMEDERRLAASDGSHAHG